MSQTASELGAASGSIVTAVVKSARGARVDVESAHFGSVSARLAVAGAYAPRAGDVALVAMAEGDFYVVGVVRALREAAPKTIEAPDGSRASLEEGADGPVWRLTDPQGRLLFEHHAGGSVVSLGGDLELRAGGDIAFSAAGEVRIEGERARLGGRTEVALTSEGSELTLDGDRALVRAAVVETHADRADLHAKEANAVVGTLRTVAHRIRERAGVVERTADRVVERAREIYREIDELSQTKAGRVRLVARTAMTLLGEQTFLKAREDVKIKGEKIHLG